MQASILDYYWILVGKMFPFGIKQLGARARAR